jgi:acyl-CoA reductase-like NAD-dependent aldehyde dehydrogenase
MLLTTFSKGLATCVDCLGRYDSLSPYSIHLQTRTTMPSSIVPHWISNRPRLSTDPAVLHHPNSGDLVHEVSNASEQDVEDAIASSHEACQYWRNTTSGVRRNVLLRAAKLLEERADEFVRTWRREMDVSHRFAEFNVRTSISMIEEIASLISSALAGELPRTADGETDGTTTHDSIQSLRYRVRPCSV